MSALPQVVKLGGELQADAVLLDGIARTLAGAADRSPIVVVHGGGPQATALQRTLGIEPKVVAGRRVTDAETLEVVKMVFAGKLNTELVAALGRHGARAVGLSGVDAGLLHVSRRPPVRTTVNGERSAVDYGFVGDVVGVQPDLLTTLLGGGYLPVVCSLAADADGTVLNVNADTVAAEVATALSASRLLVLTGVPGVFRDFGKREDLWTTLTAAQARAEMAAGTIGGGMAPKLAACVRAVGAGVGEARILDGGDLVALAQALSGTPGAGTRIAA